jgi:hypothetical protein
MSDIVFDVLVALPISVAIYIVCATFFGDKR